MRVRIIRAVIRCLPASEFKDNLNFWGKYRSESSTVNPWISFFFTFFSLIISPTFGNRAHNPSRLLRKLFSALHGACFVLRCDGGVGFHLRRVDDLIGTFADGDGNGRVSSSDPLKNFASDPQPGSDDGSVLQRKGAVRAVVIQNRVEVTPSVPEHQSGGGWDCISFDFRRHACLAPFSTL